MNMWKGNGNTTALLFFLKRPEIPHQERRTQVKTIVIEHFNGILFHKFGPANKQHTNKPTNSTVANLKVNDRRSEEKVILTNILEWTLKREVSMRGIGLIRLRIGIIGEPFE